MEETKEQLKDQYRLMGNVCIWLGPLDFHFSRAKTIQDGKSLTFKLTPEQYEGKGIDIQVLHRYDPRLPKLDEAKFNTGTYEYDGVTITRE